MRDMTVKELIDQLATKPGGARVRIWLPGSRIALASFVATASDSEVLIEGNVVEGSALG